MWDPISVFFCMWILNAKELPNQRLSVTEVIQANEQYLINKTIIDSTTIRSGI